MSFITYDTFRLDRAMQTASDALKVYLVTERVRERVPHEPKAMPVVASRKPGRNEPCPCGRLWKGKREKYKRCCGG